jgi:hypothetical protein
MKLHLKLSCLKEMVQEWLKVNLKHFTPTESGYLWAVAPNVLKNGMITHKNKMLVRRAVTGVGELGHSPQEQYMWGRKIKNLKYIKY